MNDVEEFRKQHLNTYKNATKEIINNNTKSLVENDIISLVKKPPLDSMDVIKSRLINLAKKDKVILNTEELESMLSLYRNELSTKIISLIEIRNKPLFDKIDLFEPARETEIIKISKKDLDNINKSIKKQIKEIVKESNEKILFTNMSKLYKGSETDLDECFRKFMTSNYLKQLCDSVSIKILVKDQTLMSGVMEQGERYLFTKANSHIFD